MACIRIDKKGSTLLAQGNFLSYLLPVKQKVPSNYLNSKAYFPPVRVLSEALKELCYHGLKENRDGRQRTTENQHTGCS